MSEIPPSTSEVPAIPSRTSRENRTLEEDLKDTTDEVQYREKRLRAHSSHDSEFWSSFAEYKKLERQCTDIRRKISIRDFTKQGDKSEQQWYETTEGAQVLQNLRAEDAEIKIIERQASRVDDKTMKKKRLRVF
jgi:hypothetical protein